MANHKARGQFDRAKWRLRILIPIWAIQLALTIVMMGLFSWRLGDTARHYDELRRAGDLPVVELVWETTNVGLSFIASICTVVEIFKFYGESLTPWTMLFTHIIKLTCAGAILALDIVIYVQRHDRHYSLIGLGIDGAFILTAFILVIYTIVIYRRLSKYDDYAHPANIKGYGFNDDLERETSYQGKIDAIRASVDTARHSGLRASLEVARPYASRSSSGSLSSLESVQLRTMERSPGSYNHQRDTQFDEYMARHGPVKIVVDGTDFDRSPGSPQAMPGGPLAAAGRTITRPHSGSVSRNPSYGSDGTLGAVLEEEEEASYRHIRDREALLEGRRSSDISEVSVDEADLAEARWKNQAQV